MMAAIQTRREHVTAVTAAPPAPSRKMRVPPCRSSSRRPRRACAVEWPARPRRPRPLPGPGPGPVGAASRPRPAARRSRRRRSRRSCCAAPPSPATGAATRLSDGACASHDASLLWSWARAVLCEIKIYTTLSYLTFLLFVSCDACGFPGYYKKSFTSVSYLDWSTDRSFPSEHFNLWLWIFYMDPIYFLCHYFVCQCPQQPISAFETIVSV